MLLLLAYAGMPAEELTFDNSIIISQDPRIGSFSGNSLRLIFERDYWWPTLSSNLYRPLTTLSFWVEKCFLGYGERPLGYQLGNLVLHWVNVVLMLMLALRLRLPLLVGVVAGIVFAIHPIATEAVANIVGRSDLFALTATLVSLVLYFDALEERSVRARVLRLIGCGASALLGVMAKESAIIIPALVGLHGLTRMGELRSSESARVWWRDAVVVFLTMLPAAAVFLFGRIIIAGAPGVADHPFVDNPLVAEDFFHSRAGALAVWGMQLHALFFPFGLSSDYSFNAIAVPRFSPMNASAWWSVGTLFVLGAGTWAAWRWRQTISPAAFLLAAYALSMLPTSNLILRIGSIRADRFHYLPSVFLWLALGWLAWRLWEWLRSRIPRRQATAASGLLAGWVLCLLVLAHLRCHDWRNNLTLWQSALTNAPGSVKTIAAVANESVRAQNTEASARAALDRLRPIPALFDQADIKGADRALAIYSDFGAFSTTLFDELSKNPERREEAKKILAEGLEWLEQALKYEGEYRQRWAERWNNGSMKGAPCYEVMRRNYVLALDRAGRREEAIKHLEETLEQRPFHPEFIELKGSVLENSSRKKEAAIDFMLVLVMAPERTQVTLRLGQLLKEMHPESNPWTRGPNGANGLNLQDPFVQTYLKPACQRYLAMLRKENDAYQIGRLFRTARYIYGIELEDEGDAGHA